MHRPASRGRGRRACPAPSGAHVRLPGYGVFGRVWWRRNRGACRGGVAAGAPQPAADDRTAGSIFAVLVAERDVSWLEEVLEEAPDPAVQRRRLRWSISQASRMIDWLKDQLREWT